jgi:hypothetical protein
VFTARYALSLYRKQIRFVLKGLSGRSVRNGSCVFCKEGIKSPNIVYNKGLKRAARGVREAHQFILCSPYTSGSQPQVATRIGVAGGLT